MPIAVYKLNFHAPVHFGKKRLSDGAMSIDADTLFSALYIEALQLNVSEGVLLKDLLISDTFPFENEIYYLPKPLVKINTSEEEGNHKDFKKLKYVPAHHYKDYVRGKLTSEDAKDLNEIFQVGRFGLQTKVSLSAQNIDVEADSEPYSVGTFTFEPDSGLYFIAKGSEKTLEILEYILTSLQYSGLGGKRYAGYGKFNYEQSHNESLMSLLDNRGDNYILLSSAMAKPEEIREICEGARYIIKKRSGFIQSTTYAETLVKKRDFYSFGSGSVFKKNFYGDIFNVGTEGMHPVYRYAKPLWLEV